MAKNNFNLKIDVSVIDKGLSDLLDKLKQLKEATKKVIESGNYSAKKTPMQEQVENLMVSFENLSNRTIPNFLKNYLKMGQYTEKMNLGTTFKDIVKEMVNAENEIKRISDIFINTYNKALAMNTSVRNRFSQTFTKAGIENTSKILNKADIIGGKDIFTSRWGEKFGRSLENEISRIEKAREASKYAREWLEENKELADPSLVRWARKFKQEMDLVGAGMEKGKVSIRNFALSLGILKEEMKDLIIWQARWYASKALIFTPLQIAGQTIKGFVDWEQSMKNAAAVSEYTEKELTLLKKVTMDIGKTTSISAKEASAALMEFAQAGIDAGTAAIALPLAAKMVIPTGEKMEVAVSALTTAFNAWKLSASDVPKVASEIGAAMAESKLKIADLSTIFNYLATTASQFNLSTKETLSLVTILSKGGVMPSTIGTGIRQTLAQLAKQPPRVRKILDEAGKTYGWTARDFNPDLNPPMEAFRKLFTLIKDGVLIATDVFKGFEMRAGANIVALAKMFVTEWDKVIEKIGDPTWLERAFKTSMEGISNQLKRSRNIIEAELYPALDKAGGKFAEILKTINDVEVRFKVIESILKAGLLLGLLKFLVSLKDIVIWLGKILTKLGAIRLGLITLSAGWTIPIGIIITAISIAHGVLEGLKGEIKEKFSDKIKEITTEDLKKTLEELEYGVGVTGLQSKNIPQFYKKLGFDKSSLLIDDKMAIDAIKKELDKRSKGIVEGYEPSPGIKKELTSKKPPVSATKWESILKRVREQEIAIEKSYLKVKEAIIDAAYKRGLVDEKSYYETRLDITETSLLKELEYAEEYRDEFKGKLKKQLREELEANKDNKEKQEALINEFNSKQLEAEKRVTELQHQIELERINRQLEYTEKLKAIYIERQNILFDIRKIALEKELSLEESNIEKQLTIAEWAYNKNILNPARYFELQRYKIELEKINTIKRAYEDFTREREEALTKFLGPKEERANLSDYVYSAPNLDKLEIYIKDYEKALGKYNKAVQDASQKFELNILQLELKRRDTIKNIYTESGTTGVIKKSFIDIADSYNDVATQIYDTTLNIVKNMEDAFANFLDYTSQDFMDWKKLITDILHSIYMEILKTFLMKQIVGGILGGIFGTTDIGNIGLKILGKASGGTVSVNKAYLVGEKGPELFIPNANGNIIPNNTLIPASMSASPVYINIENKTGANVRATQSQPYFDGKRMVRNVMLELANNDPTIRSKYGVR